MAEPTWRMQLVPASFRGAEFHIDANSRASGRRMVLHEFPKRDIPYAEDMGRKARGFPINGYVIGPDYKSARDDLIDALETEGPGQLVLPTLGQWQVQVRDYTVRETRQAGGMAEFEMQFVEAGEESFSANTDTQSQAQAAADNTEAQTVTTSNTELKYGDKGIGSA